ncbi:MAG: hypothetical protein A2017_18585 [Lentisphaerae bacterium GWF2_44_16]|nr:MAG: hypothetical protein A2017_18585 [Lentisphaerae bacterium GWF2_44_16]
MTRLIRMTTFAALVMMQGCNSGVLSQKDEFFKPAKDVSESYPKDKIYPQGRIFPYTGFSPQKSSYDKKFTMCGPVYNCFDKLLEEAAEIHKKAICTIRVIYKGKPVTLETFKQEKDFDFQEIAEFVKKEVAALAGNENIAWWYLTPEELKSWRKNEIKYLETVSNAIRETDPLKRPIWMYDPGHRDAKGLGETVKFLDICGKGMFTNYSNFKDSRIFCRWSIEQEIEAIKNNNPSAIPIALPEMFREPAPEDVKLIPSWVRHDTYSALITGAKGLAVFSFANRKNFKSHDIYFQEYVNIADELCGELNLGQVFLFGEPRNDISLKITAGPATLPFLYRNSGMKEPVEFSSVGIFNAAYKNERYLFLASSANVPVSAEISGFPAGQCVIEDVFNKKQIDSKISPLKLVFAPLEVKCIKFKQK